MTVKTGMDPAAAAGPIRTLIHGMDKDLAVYDVKTMRQAADTSLAPVRFSLTLIGLFATMALILAALGLYGVVSYNVRQRTREIGVRMALGATSLQVARFVLAQTARPVIVGLIIGAGLAAALATLVIATPVGAQIAQIVHVTDPIAYASSLMVIVAACLIAAWIPARRAARLDPIKTLRQD